MHRKESAPSSRSGTLCGKIVELNGFSRQPTQLRTLTLFLLIGLAWGLGFLFIRIAVQGMSPLQYVFARVTVAALVLTLVMVGGKRAWPRGFHAWKHVAVLGVSGLFASSFFYGLAGERIPSALSAIYNSSVPIVTVLITMLALRQERVGLRKVIAILVGAVGILVVISPGLRSNEGFDLGGQLFALCGVLSMAFTFAYTRKFVTPLNLDPVGVASGQAVVAAALSIPLVLFSDPNDLSLTPAIVGSIVMLGAVSSGVSYVWNFQVIQQWGAPSASMVTYLTTIVGVIAGVIFLQEKLTIEQIIGACIVLVAVAIGINKPNPKPQTKESTHGNV